MRRTTLREDAKAFGIAGGVLLAMVALAGLLVTATQPPSRCEVLLAEYQQAYDSGSLWSWFEADTAYQEAGCEAETGPLAEVAR